MTRINEAEELLYLHLREKGIQAERECRFEPKRRWRVDFLLPTLRLAVEIEGGAYVNGRHTQPSGFVKDMEKYNALTKRGIRLLRYTPEQVLDDTAIVDIVRTLKGETP